MSRGIRHRYRVRQQDGGDCVRCRVREMSHCRGHEQTGATGSKRSGELYRAAALVGLSSSLPVPHAHITPGFYRGVQFTTIFACCCLRSLLMTRARGGGGGDLVLDCFCLIADPPE